MMELIAERINDDWAKKKILGYYREINISPDKLDLISGYLNLICARVIESVDLEQTQTQDGLLYQKVVSYLSEHYTEDVSLEKVARLFGYHRKYLSHTLHSLTGIHWSQLLEYYRVNCAKRLLEGDLPLSVTEVALKSGFSAMNTFHRSFKRLTGQTPLAYRRAHGK
jgi:YesN/AraC family two-component response regulator